jgi:mannose-P-dolichol utilization defect protein 1
LNGLSLILASAGKLIQIHANWKNGSTGVLSAFTLILQFLGCVARIFTSIQETGDSYMILNYVVVSAINGILVWQLVYYWNSDKNKKKKQKKKE